MAAVGPPPAVRGGGGVREGGVERKPRGRAWQMRRQKPARALLIKHNEAWDHKVFCLIPGSHGGGADQLGRQRRKVYRETPGAGWRLEQGKLGAAAPNGLVQGRRGVGAFSQASISAWKEAAIGDFSPQKRPTPAGGLVPVTGPSGLPVPHMK